MKFQQTIRTGFYILNSQQTEIKTNKTNLGIATLGEIWHTLDDFRHFARVDLRCCKTIITSQKSDESSQQLAAAHNSNSTTETTP